jgi:uncharacterized protein YoaH (UPF0181 family)
MSVSLRRFSSFFAFFLILFNACQCQASASGTNRGQNLVGTVERGYDSASGRNAGSLGPTNKSPKGIADGAGIWVNMWNYPAEADSYCLKLYASGIRNIFIQTSRSNTAPVCNPEGLSRLLSAAHRYQMRVIAWSFDELANPDADADKVIAAANFRGDQGDKVDAVAANMEKDLSANKIKQFCGRIRQSLGNSYPLIAVVYSPLNHAAVVAGTPWTVLAESFSVLAVMSYWHSRYTKSEAYQYTLATIKQLRQLTGKADLNIHVIGDGMGTDSLSINQFLTACRTGAATSASLYPNQRVTADQLSTLSRYPEFFPANGRLRLVAYRELVKSNKLSLPPGEDPASNINRRLFYQLLVRQFYPSALSSAANLAGSNASPPGSDNVVILRKAGVLTELPQTQEEMSQFLAAGMSYKEAIETVARLIESKGRNNKSVDKQRPRLAGRQYRQADHFFVQPAYAAESGVLSQQPLSYFDAAQMVLLASGGVK